MIEAARLKEDPYPRVHASRRDCRRDDGSDGAQRDVFLHPVPGSREHRLRSGRDSDPWSRRMICRHDPNTFRILLAWIETRGRARNSTFWGGPSCTPLKLVRRYRTRDVGYA